MDLKELLTTHVNRYENFSNAATDPYMGCRAEYAQLAEAESRIIAALIAKMG